MKYSKIKMIAASIAVGAMMIAGNLTVMADNSSVIVFTSPYDNYFHIDGCKTLNGGGNQTNLQDVLDRGLAGCSTCAANQLVPAGSSNNSSSNDAGNNANNNTSNKSSSNLAADNSSSNSGDVEVTVTIGDENGADSQDNKNNSGSSNSSKNSNSSNLSNGSNSSSSSNSSKSTASNSSKSSKPKTATAAVPGQLMTEKQRKAAFFSKTNPKRGAKPVTVQRPANAGFYYADFATYNSYNSENHMGGTPIYLLGTIMQMEPVAENGDYYNVAMMVNDCDGYQWYMRVNCNKAKYGIMKAELIGKAANIFGTYAGYSGVTNRPMMDATMVFEVGGNTLNLAIYL